MKGFKIEYQVLKALYKNSSGHLPNITELGTPEQLGLSSNSRALVSTPQPPLSPTQGTRRPSPEPVSLWKGPLGSVTSVSSPG